MQDRISPPELKDPTVSYHAWSLLTRSSELVELTLPEIEFVDDPDLQDALWKQYSTAAFGDGKRAIAVYTSPDHGTHSYSVPTRPIIL